MSVVDNIEIIKRDLPSTTRLVAVSKMVPDELILEAYNGGHLDFGENRPQDLSKRMERLPDDIRWHFIGKLQTNKIKMIIGRVYLIHSVDSLRLLEALSKESVKRGIVTSILIQQHISKDISKQGFDAEEMLKAAMMANEIDNIRLRGVMGMATFTDDMSVVGEEFRALKLTFDKIKRDLYSEDPSFSEISMGMSGDYLTAVKEGSTLVRVGTSVFKR